MTRQHMLYPGKKLGPYIIDKELGSGSMGTVFRARDPDKRRRVAIKVIATAISHEDEVAARFEREVDILQQLRHPNIVRLLTAGRYKKSPFYAMEYIEGVALDQILKEKGKMDWQEVLPWVLQLCAALQHAHERGIVHRDLKPSNLMLLADGTIKLTDFGIARHLDLEGLTSVDLTVGTAAYMSPEQCHGAHNLSHKSDLYSLGVVLFELVTGRKLYEAATAMEWFIKHTHEEPLTPREQGVELPADLEKLIISLLQKKPEDRPDSAQAVYEMLVRIKQKYGCPVGFFDGLKSFFISDATARDPENDRLGVRSLNLQDRLPSWLSARTIMVVLFSLPILMAIVALIVGMLNDATKSKSPKRKSSVEANRPNASHAHRPR